MTGPTAEEVAALVGIEAEEQAAMVDRAITAWRLEGARAFIASTAHDDATDNECDQREGR